MFEGYDIAISEMLMRVISPHYCLLRSSDIVLINPGKVILQCEWASVMEALLLDEVKKTEEKK